MGNVINTGMIVLHDAHAGASVPFRLAFSFGDGSLLGPEKKAFLVVYDLDQYLEHQKALPSGAGEVGTDFFVGKKTRFDNAPDHEVAPGTGVLFVAEVKFAPQPKSKDWFVESVASPQAIGARAFDLELRCMSAVDEHGVPLSPKVIDARPIAKFGPDKKDFEAFTQFGASTRKLTVRLLSLDRLRVLVSQLNPAHCPAQRPVSIRYDSGRSPLQIFQVAPAPAPAPAPKPTETPVDLTGQYIELIEGQPVPSEPLDALSPATLYIHHIGRAVCGWYVPFSSQVLSARKPSTTNTVGDRIYPADIEQTMMSTTRMVFVVGQRYEAINVDFPAECLFTDDHVDPDIDHVDPDILRARVERAGGSHSASPGAPNSDLVIPPDKRVGAMVRFELDSAPVLGRFCARIQIFIPSRNHKSWTFVRMCGESRLSWSVIHELKRDNPIPADRRKQLVDDIVSDLVEPIAPGVLARITGFIASREMQDLLTNWATAKNSSPSGSSLRLAAEGLIDDALEHLADTIKSVTNSGEVPPALVTQVRSVARYHEFIFDGASDNMLGALEKVSVDIIERELAKNPQNVPGQRPFDLEDRMRDLARSAAFRGFAAFNIRPARDFLYRFTFSSFSRGTSYGLFLHGAIGGCTMRVEKLDPATRSPIDPARFPAHDFRAVFAAGAIGVGVKLDLAGVGRDGAAPSPQSCEVIHFADLQPGDFDGATFSFSISGGTGSLQGGPGIGVGGQSLPAMFSLLTRSAPPVSLEAEIPAVFKMSPKLPGGMKILDWLRKIAEAIASGDPKKVPAARGQAALIALSLIKGYVLWDATSQPIDHPIDMGKTLESLVDKPLDANVRIVGAQFARGSAVVTDDARQMLELRLAVLRKLLEYPGWMDIEGTTSPEWSNATRTQAKQNNLELSQHRADAVREAVFAATGRPGKIIPSEKDIHVQGKGSTPFDPDFTDQLTQGFHVNPFSPNAQQPGSAEAKAVAEDEKNFYPELRRVDIAMNGVFAVRLPAK